MGGVASNVVLVTVDSLRRDAVAPYADRHTPTVERLAERGVQFDHAFATGNWTPFSFPSILGSQAVFADGDGIGIGGGTTLAERLQSAGYATAGFNAANGFLTSHWGYDEGFDTFEPFVASVGSSVYSRYLATHPTVEAWVQLATSPVRRLAARLRGDRDEQAFLEASRGLDVESAAVEFLQETDRPFFLWLHYMDPHTPYVPAPRYVREVTDNRLGTHRMLSAHIRTGLGREVGPRTLSSLRTLYRAAVRQTDDSLGRVLDTLETAGVRDETAVVVAGDHGEEFQEHGHLAHYPKLYDELTRVPLIVDAPGVSRAAPIDGAVGLDAIPPTVCELLGVDPPDEWRGTSVARVGPEWDGEATPVVSTTVRGDHVTAQPIPRRLADGDPIVSARTAQWTLIERPATGDRELFHRPSDPAQANNLLAATDSESDTTTTSSDSTAPMSDSTASMSDSAATVSDSAASVPDSTASMPDSAAPMPDEATMTALESAVEERLTAITDSDDAQTDDPDAELEARLSALGYR